MLIEEHLQKTVQVSLGTSPENMLKTSLEICTELAGGEGGSILGEEGPALQFLFSDVEELIGMRVPFDSIAGVTVNKNMVVYTYAPSDKRHFNGIDKQIAKQTNYLLSIPIPSIHPPSVMTNRQRMQVHCKYFSMKIFFRNLMFKMELRSLISVISRTASFILKS